MKAMELYVKNMTGKIGDQYDMTDVHANETTKLHSTRIMKH